MCVAPYVAGQTLVFVSRAPWGGVLPFSLHCPSGPRGCDSTGQGKCVYGTWCVLACLYKYVGQEFVHPQR